MNKYFFGPVLVTTTNSTAPEVKALQEESKRLNGALVEGDNVLDYIVKYLKGIGGENTVVKTYPNGRDSIFGDMVVLSPESGIVLAYITYAQVQRERSISEDVACTSRKITEF